MRGSATRKAAIRKMVDEWMEDGAGAFAAEDLAEGEAVSADPHVELFGEPDDAGDPEEERHGDEEGHAHAEEADAAGAPVDFPLRGDAVDRLPQFGAGEVWLRLFRSEPDRFV